MFRSSRCFYLAGLILFASTADANAQDFRSWLKFFEGQWNAQERYRVYPANADPGDAEWNTGDDVTEWKAVEGVDALIVVRRPPRASTSTLGWDPVKSALIQTGYLANGSCFRVEFSKIQPEALEGEVTVSFASGASGKGNFRVTRNGESEREYRTEWKVRASDDMIVEGDGIFKK